MADYQLSYTGAQIDAAIGKALAPNELILSTAVYSVGATLPFSAYPVDYDEVSGRLAYIGIPSARAYGTPPRFTVFAIKLKAPHATTSATVIYCASLICDSSAKTVALENAYEISISASGEVTATKLESIQIGPLYGNKYLIGSAGRGDE